MPDESELRAMRAADGSLQVGYTVHAPGSPRRANPMVVPASFKAEMARRGIAPHQLGAWISPDEGFTDPLDDPEVRAAVRHCLNDVWHAPEHHYFGREANDG